MPTRNRLGNLRNVLYRLKRGYGLKVDIYIDGVDTINLATVLEPLPAQKQRLQKVLFSLRKSNEPLSTTSDILKPIQISLMAGFSRLLIQL
jgi:hypothetical protein